MNTAPHINRQEDQIGGQGINGIYFSFFPFFLGVENVVFFFRFFLLSGNMYDYLVRYRKLPHYRGIYIYK